MAKEVRVTKIEVAMGDKTVTLTIDQARALREQLDSLFGAKVERHYHSYPQYIPWPYPRYSHSLDGFNGKATLTYKADSNSACLSI